MVFSLFVRSFDDNETTAHNLASGLDVSLAQSRGSFQPVSVRLHHHRLEVNLFINSFKRPHMSPYTPDVTPVHALLSARTTI